MHGLRVQIQESPAGPGAASGVFPNLAGRIRAHCSGRPLPSLAGRGHRAGFPAMTGEG